jgi:hypothetical protein
MQVDLHNFFKYYDDKNPKHKAAVDQLEVELTKKCPDLIDDTSNWIKIYRTKPVLPKSTILSVPYYPQTDNYRDASRTCNSSSCAMCLEFFKPTALQGAKGDDAYIKKVFAVGDTTDHSVQTKVLASYGIKSEFRYNLSFADLDKELAAGHPVVIGILHRGTLSAPTGGHMVVVIGKNEKGDYVINDPYGNLMDGYTTDVYNGRGVVYPKNVLDKRWLADGPNTGWGRIFTP